jgi:hypothetical protein
LVDQMIARLTQFGKIGVAKLSADQSLAGDLYVDGKPSGAFSNGGAEVTLPVGEHRFEVRGNGKVLAAATATVSGTAPSEITLKAPLAGHADDAKAPESSSPTNWKRTAGYVGVGLGGALIVGGVYSMIKVNSINHDDRFTNYAKGFGPNEDVCQRAGNGAISRAPGAGSPDDVKSLCDSGSTFQTLQWVFLGLGVASAGAGAYLLATSPKSEPTQGKLTVMPRVGKTENGVDLRLVF